MPVKHVIVFGSETLELRADRSLWWPRRRMLFIADVHAGKTRHMVRAGLPIPAGSLETDLKRLSASVAELQPERIIVLGDLFHSDVNNEWQQLVAWRRTLLASFELVRGNHDRFMKDAVLQAGGIIVHPEGYYVKPFSLRHHPQAADAEQLTLCGHVHPVYKAYGPGRDRLRLACFVVQATQIIVPAYGSFTGGYDVSKYHYSQLIGCGPDFQNLVIKHKRR